jgi:hypothetical protein
MARIRCRRMRRALLLVPMLLAACLGPPPAPEPVGEGLPDQPAPLAWTTLGDGPAPRTEVVVGALGGDFYVIGGFMQDSAALVPTRRVDVFDVAGDAWRRGPDFPHPLHHGAAVEFGGILYVLGGYTIGFAPTSLGFKLVDGSWAATAPLPKPRGSHVAGVLDGRILLAAGTTIGPGGLMHARDIDVYDPATDSGRPLTSRSRRRAITPRAASWLACSSSPQATRPATAPTRPPRNASTPQGALGRWARPCPWFAAA